MEPKNNTSPKDSPAVVANALLSDAAAIIRKGFTPPFKYDHYGTAVFDSENKHVIDVRGFGHLQYLGEGVADSVQMTIGTEVTAHLNDLTGHNSNRVIGHITGDAGVGRMIMQSPPTETIVIEPRHSINYYDDRPLPFANYSSAGLKSLYDQIQAKTCKLSRAERNAVVREYNRRGLD